MLEILLKFLILQRLMMRMRLKILFSQTEELLAKKMLEIPKEFFSEYNVVKTMPIVLEVMDKDCNKGYGVKVLANKLGIKKEEICSC
jgi:hydroxymethylpyrimidine pyrophosphatase-like HAD family hydrolase